MEGVFDLLTGVDACFGVSVGGLLRVDEGGRAGVDVGVLDLRFVRDAGLDGCLVEVDVLLSLVSGWRAAPLEKDDGGSLPVDLVFACLVVFWEGLVATEGEAGLVVGGGEATVG